MLACSSPINGYSNFSDQPSLGEGFLPRGPIKQPCMQCLDFLLVERIKNVHIQLFQIPFHHVSIYHIIAYTKLVPVLKPLDNKTFIYKARVWLLSIPMTESDILLVDDDIEDVEMIEEVFREAHQQVGIQKAHNGMEALTLLNRLDKEGSLPCLIVLDINMPLMNGKETLAHIKQNPRYKQIPVVVFSTSSNPEDKVFCEQYGAEMIRKPTLYTMLKEVIQKLLNICET